MFKKTLDDYPTKKFREPKCQILRMFPVSWVDVDRQIDRHIDSSAKLRGDYRNSLYVSPISATFI